MSEHLSGVSPVPSIDLSCSSATAKLVSGFMPEYRAQ
jgi:hypothetical protein